jgi:hypothetical protein
MDRGVPRLVSIVGVQRWDANSKGDEWGELKCYLVVAAGDAAGQLSQAMLHPIPPYACAPPGPTQTSLLTTGFSFDSNSELLGVRSEELHQGYGFDELSLFRISGTQLERVFAFKVELEPKGAFVSQVKMTPSARGPNKIALVMMTADGKKSPPIKFGWNGKMYVKN